MILKSMQREIKFRAWLVNDKKMVDWKSILSTGQYMKNYFCGGSYEGSDSVLQQYTGIKDINGKEIYEGDIMSWNDGKVFTIVKWISENDEWDFSGWYISQNYSNYGPYIVVGNIFENSELLDNE